MRPLRYSINVTLDGCCDHRAILPDEDLHRHAVESLEQADEAVRPQTAANDGLDVYTSMSPTPPASSCRKNYAGSSYTRLLLPPRICQSIPITAPVPCSNLVRPPQGAAPPSFHEVPWNDGKGTVYGLAFADFDGDGWPDIMAARSDAPNGIWFNTKPGDGR